MTPRRYWNSARPGESTASSWADATGAPAEENVTGCCGAATMSVPIISVCRALPAHLGGRSWTIAAFEYRARMASSSSPTGRRPLSRPLPEPRSAELDDAADAVEDPGRPDLERGDDLRPPRRALSSSVSKADPGQGRPVEDYIVRASCRSGR